MLANPALHRTVPAGMMVVGREPVRAGPAGECQLVIRRNASHDPMTTALSIHPRLEAYRSLDGSRYVFMEMALVDPGHYASHGKLRTMSRDEVRVAGLDHVNVSLSEFPSRRRQPLRLDPGEPDSFGYHVSVRLASSTRMELTPYRVHGIQRRMDEQTQAIELPVSPEDFFEKLEGAFSVAASTAG